MYYDLIFQVFIEHVKDLNLAQFVLFLIFKHVFKVPAHFKTEVFGYLFVHQELVDMQDLLFEDCCHSIRSPCDCFDRTDDVSEDTTSDKHAKDRIDFLTHGIGDHISIADCGHCRESPIQRDDIFIYSLSILHIRYREPTKRF